MNKELTRRDHDPFRDMVGLRDTLSGLFDDFFNGRPAPATRSMQADLGMGWVPAVNVSENEDAIIVCAALPGVEKGDVELEVKEHTLILTGKVKETGGSEDGWLRRELPSGRFYRAFNLGADMDSAKLSANFKNGVLEIKLPKAEKSKPRKVPIA